MPGARIAPVASGAKIKSTPSKSTTVTPDSPGIPRANGFNGFLRALPGEPGFLAPVASRIASTRLDAGVGASGPHDFAVRFMRHSSKAHSRPPHSTPTFETMRETPLFIRRETG